MRTNTQEPPSTALLEAALAYCPRVLIEQYESKPLLRLAIDVLSVFATFVVVKKVVLLVTRLPLEGYQAWSMTLALVSQVHWLWWVATLLAACLLSVYGALLTPWSKLGWGESRDIETNYRALRIFVVAIAVVVVWPFVTYDYNHFLGQSHTVDRLLAVGLLIALWWRPVFVLPLVVLLFSIMWQFIQPPLGGSILAHKLQVLYPLMLFSSAFLVYSATGRMPCKAFAALLLCMLGAAYWEAALAKFELGWLAHNQLHLIMPAAYSHGWLNALDPNTITKLAQGIRPFETVAQYAVMIIEAACLFILAHRKLAQGLLASLIVFHIGVFVIYGFFFWTWIAVNAATIWLIWRVQPQVFGSRGLIFGIPLVLFGSLWAHAPHLGWLDTRLTYTYQVQGIDMHGNVHDLAPSYFAPYEDVFTMASLSYLADHPALTSPYGVTSDRVLAQTLVNQDLSRELVEQLEARVDYNPRDAKKQRFINFMQTFAHNRAAAENRACWLRALQPPRQFWGRYEHGDCQWDVSLNEVVVKEVTTAFNDTGPEVLRELTVVRIPLETAQN